MLASAWADFQANLWLYLSMPITSGLVGYATNVLAIKMMFYPKDFIGKPPLFGWQGVVPRKAEKMAGIACDTLVPNLVTEREVFERLDPDRVAEELEGPVLELVDQLIDEIMSEFEPTIWETIPLRIRDMMVRRAQQDSPEVVAEIMDQIKDSIDQVFDLKRMVTSTLTEDKSLINKVFLETGRAEFVFIGRSGFYFGCIFGLFQMIGWTFYKGDFQLPLFGLLVGYLTNFIALRMIFRPQLPKKFGPLTIQGLFHKRQKEVARDYARLIADEIVTPRKILEAVLTGVHSDRVFTLIARNVQRAIDEQAGFARPFVALAVGSRKYIQMKQTAVDRLVKRLPETLHVVDNYAKEAMDIASILSSRLERLSPPAFEKMLRPAFQEDEWMLIAVGAALGFCVGVGQLIVFKAIAVTPAMTGAAAVLGLG